MMHGQVGPLTLALEELAGAAGTGTVLGGLGIGLASVVAGAPRLVVERRVLTGGYLGGIGGVVVAVTEAVARYAG